MKRFTVIALAMLASIAVPAAATAEESIPVGVSSAGLPVVGASFGVDNQTYISSKINQTTLTVWTAAANPRTYPKVVERITLSVSGGSGTGTLTYYVRSGPGSISGSALSINGAGNIVVYAVKAGDVTYNATTSADLTITVNKADQVALAITSPGAKTYGDAAFQLATTGGEGTGAVSYSRVSGPGTVSTTGEVTITGAGDIVVQATKAADDNYNAVTSENLTITVSSSGPTTYYVAAARPDDSGNGLSWATAKKSIQAAIGLAVSDDTIVVTNGTYAPISITTDLPVLIQSVNGADVTIIDGGGTSRCATLGFDSMNTNTVLTGFTLRNGSADSGGGSCYGTLNNCTFSANTVDAYGGGSYFGVLNNCTLIGNTSTSGGGGGSYRSTLNNCTLSGNTAPYDGGGSYVSTLNNCTLSGNTTSGSGGGSYQGTLNNCTLSGNIASTEGGGSYLGTLNNCTLSGNTASGNGGGSFSDTVKNCIVWGNFVNGATNNYFAGTFDHSCTTPLPSGTGNIAADPLFVDASVTNLRLRAESPCINAGLNAAVSGATDLDGNPRIVGGVVDMGCYEVSYSNQVALVITSPGAKTYGDAAFQLATTGGSGTGVVTYSLVSGPGTVSSNGLVTITGAGEIVVQATKASDANYNAVTSTNLTITVNKADQAALTITSPGSKTYGDVPFQLTASGGSVTGVVSYARISGPGTVSSNGLVTITGAGDIVVQASKAGNDNYNSVTSSNLIITVNKADQAALTITSPGTKTYGAVPFQLTTSGGSITGVVSYARISGPGTVSSNGLVTITGAGDIVVQATKTGNANYNAVTSSNLTITVNKANQAALTITSPGSKTYGDVPFQLTANGGSITGVVSYVRISGPGTVSSSGLVTITGAGAIVVQATKTGNANYNAVTSAELSITVTRPSQMVFYADAEKLDDSGDGFSWATAKKTIQAAIGLAVSNDTVVVTNGIYAPISITGNRPIHIRSVNGADVTIIDGGGTNRCALLGSLNTHTNTVLTGFTLRNGNAVHGGGSHYGTLNNCTLIGNMAQHGGGSYYGTLNNCMFRGNSASMFGGGSFESTLNTCTLSGNTSSMDGGGSYSGTLNNCRFSGNSAGARGGGSVYGTLNNCTLFGNTSSMSRGGGGSCFSALFNCVVWGNLADGATNNCAAISNIAGSCTWPLPSGTGNIAADPLFVDVAATNLRLRVDSPCINAGTNGAVLGGTDLDGNPRIIGGRVDMGCYESPFTNQVALVVADVGSKLSGDAPFQLTASGGSGTGAVSYSLVSGPGTVSPSGLVTITGIGEIVVQVVKAADANYTAVQTQITITVTGVMVTFEPQGGTIIPVQTGATLFQTVYTNLPSAVREDYTFRGWYATWTNGAVVVSNQMPVVVQANHVLYAKWVARDGGTAGTNGLGVVLNPDGKGVSIRSLPGASGVVALPDRMPNTPEGLPVTEIASYAFCNRKGVTDVKVGIFVTNIADFSFAYCSTLTNVLLLQPIDFKTGLPTTLTIGKGAFGLCESLVSVTIPEGTIRIGQRAFAQCFNLTAVKFECSVAPAMPSDVFTGTPKTGRLTVQVPSGSTGYSGGVWDTVTVEVLPALRRLFSMTISRFGIEAGNSTALRSFSAVPVAERFSLAISVSGQDGVSAAHVMAQLLAESRDKIVVEYRTQLDGTFEQLSPAAITDNGNGSATIFVDVPAGNKQGFFRVVIKD